MAFDLARAATNGGKTLVQLKGLFFDRTAVEKAADKAKTRVLAKVGAWVRRAAQTSMRYRKAASAAGQPPSAHKDGRLAALKKMKRSRHNGALLRELLFFSFDPATKSVVVGPLGFKTRGGLTVPALHEFGGTRQAGKGEVLAVKNKPGRDAKGKFVSAGERLVKIAGKTLRYPARPFMRPALEKVLPKFAAAFKGSISR